jgi:hypothetical protein
LTTRPAKICDAMVQFSGARRCSGHSNGGEQVVLT